MRREQHRGVVLLPSRTPRSRNETGCPLGAEGMAPSRTALRILGIGGDGRLSLKATVLVPSYGSASNSNFYVVARE
jgi:hypothetical protein